MIKVTRRCALGAGLALAGLIAGKSAAWAAPVDVAAIYTVPVEQQWVSRIHKALKAAEARGEVTYAWSENVANTDYERVMRDYAEGGKKLIVGEVFGVERAARQVAQDYPETAFLMGSSFPPQAPNFAVFDNYIQECSYLTGLVAGSLTNSGRIGMVGGYPIPEVNRLMHAFMAGVREQNPNATFSVSFIGSWYDPPKAKEAAFAMIDQGADILYAERFGVSDAAKERGVKAIGNVIDTAADYPGTVVASALWHMEPSIGKVVQAVAGGSFAAEDYGPLSHLGAGGCSLAPMDPTHDTRRRARRGEGEGGGDPRRIIQGRGRRQRAQVGRVTAALRLSGITKRFGGTVANDGIDLELEHGEVLALLGENGAGKTTLMSILFGHYVADAGTVEAADAAGELRPLPPGSPGAALAAGIGMVHQHFALAASLSAMDNVLLGTEPLWSPRRRRRVTLGRLRGDHA